MGDQSAENSTAVTSDIDEIKTKYVKLCDQLKEVVQCLPTLMQNDEKSSLRQCIVNREKEFSTFADDYKKGKDVIRIASWNVHKPSPKNDVLFMKKVKVIRQTIEHYKFDVVAFQEVNEEALKKLLEMGGEWKAIIGTVHKGSGGEKAGFLYKKSLSKEKQEESTPGTAGNTNPNESQSAAPDEESTPGTAGNTNPNESQSAAPDIQPIDEDSGLSDMKLITVVPDQNLKMWTKKYFLSLVIEGYELINTHIKKGVSVHENKSKFGQIKGENSLLQSNNVLFLGDFNQYPIIHQEKSPGEAGPQDTASTDLSGYEPVFCEDEKTNTLKTEHYDNFLVHKDVIKKIQLRKVAEIQCSQDTEVEWTKRSASGNERTEFILCRLEVSGFTPDMISDHCPIFIDLKP